MIHLFALAMLRPQAVPLPDTWIGRKGDELLQALSDRNGDRLRKFFAESVTGLDSADSLTLADKVRRQSGGLVPFSVESVGSNMVVIDASDNARRRWTRCFLVGGAGNKLRDVGFMAIGDPSLKAAAALPRQMVSPREAAKLVDRSAKFLASHDAFSGTVLVSKGDEVLLLRGYNLADRDHNVPNGPHTRFHIASMGKMITAVAIAQLVGEGKLSFESRLIEVLPDYPNREAAQKITVGQLLSHQSGLGMLFDRPNFDRRRKHLTHADYFPVFAGEPLMFEPGAHVRYSNEGFVVLGAVIERLSGLTYDKFVRDRIFAPAGMIETGPASADEVVPNRAVGYLHSEDDPLSMDPRQPNWTFLQSDTGNAAGGYYSSAPDMFRFARALVSGKLLPRRMFEELIRARVAIKGGKPDYGYGFDLADVLETRVVGHEGGGPNSGIESILQFSADGRFTVVVMGNYDPPAAKDLCNDIVRMLSMWRS